MIFGKSTKSVSVTDPVEVLVSDTFLLAQYAREQGILPDVVEEAQQLLNKYKPGKFNDKEISATTILYETLSRAAGSVTPKTLIATSLDVSYWRSEAGRHLLKLWTLTLLAVLFILLYSLLDYRIKLFVLPKGAVPDQTQYFWYRLQYITNYLLPFTYGCLGSCAYLLRVSADKLRTREFNPDRIPEHWNRLVLGTLSGGVVVLFIQSEDGLPIAEGALGFLAGYSIDFLFQTLDRVIAAILPKTGLDTVAKKAVKRKQIMLINRYQEMLNKTKNADAKKILTEIINDLQS